MIERWLELSARYARGHYRLVFAVLVVLLAVSVFLASRLQVDTEVLNLLPQDDPVVRTFREALSDFGSLDVLLVVVRIPKGEVPDPYLDFADGLGKELEALSEIGSVDYRAPDLEVLVEEHFPSALLFLDEKELREVASRLDDDGIRARAGEVRRLLETPESLATAPLLRLDPLGISASFLDRAAASQGALDVDWASGYLLSADRSMLLLIARPTEPAQEIEFARRLLAEVDEAVARAEEDWSWAGEFTPPVVDYGGTYATAVSDAGTLTRDIITNAGTSIVAVLLLFWFAFRRLGVVGYAFVPLASGMILALGFAGATVGLLNAITSSFAALLVGLGIDFVIVSYGRYVEERRRGVPVDEALALMTGSSGRAVITGGMTTAATFYAFAATKFTGLRQMGLLVGTGILFCMVAVIVLLPALLAWSEDRGTARRKPMKRFLHGFGSKRLVRFSYRHPWPVLAAGLLLSAVAAFLARGLEFEDSIRDLRPSDNRGVMIESEVGEKFGSGFDYMMLVLEADSEAAVLGLTERAMAMVRELGTDELRSVDSISDVLPSAAQQEKARRFLDEHSETFLPERVLGSFQRAAAEVGLSASGFERGLELYRQAAEAKPVGFYEFAAAPMTRRLLGRYLREDEGVWKSVVYLHPPPRTWKREAPPGVLRIAEQLAAEVDGGSVVLTGVNRVSETLRNQILEDAVVAAVLGFVIVAIMLCIDFRRIDDALYSLAPLVVGVTWMLAGMAALGQKMNFFNVFVATMIIGIGVDYGVHMVHRFRELASRASDDLRSGLEETGKAIVMAALSTSVGFGSLSLSSYPGLRSIGFAAILGALATSLVSITLLPALFGLRHARR